MLRGRGVWLVLGVWLLGVGANYLTLALHAHKLSRPGQLDAELADLDLGQSLRAATRAQVWIAVPFALVSAGYTHRSP